MCLYVFVAPKSTGWPGLTTCSRKLLSSTWNPPPFFTFKYQMFDYFQSLEASRVLSVSFLDFVFANDSNLRSASCDRSGLNTLGRNDKKKVNSPPSSQVHWDTMCGSWRHENRNHSLHQQICQPGSCTITMPGPYFHMFSVFGTSISLISESKSWHSQWWWIIGLKSKKSQKLKKSIYLI